MDKIDELLKKTAAYTVLAIAFVVISLLAQIVVLIILLCMTTQVT